MLKLQYCDTKDKRNTTESTVQHDTISANEKILINIQLHKQRFWPMILKGEYGYLAAQQRNEN